MQPGACRKKVVLDFLNYIIVPYIANYPIEAKLFIFIFDYIWFWRSKNLYKQ